MEPCDELMSIYLSINRIYYQTNHVFTCQTSFVNCFRSAT